MTTPAVSRGITEIDVWRAADALLLEGARPTIERVRNKIGRGSPNTVSPHLETWFRSLGARIADPMAFSSPPTLPDPIAEAANHFWEAALTAARAEAAVALDAGRTELAEARARLSFEKNQLQSNADKLLAQAQAKDEALEIQKIRAAEFQQQLNAHARELAKRDETIAQLRGEIAETRSAQEEVRSRFDKDRAAFDLARLELEAREASHANRWAMEVDRARESAKAASNQLLHVEKELTARVAEMARALEAAEREKHRATEALRQSEEEIQQLRRQAAADASELRGIKAGFRDREGALVAQYERAQAQLSDVLEQLASKDREHGELLRTLVASANSRSGTKRRFRSSNSG